MLGRARAGFGVARVVLIDGADGIEKRVELAAGEINSVDDKDEFERTEKRKCQPLPLHSCFQRWCHTHRNGLVG